MVLNLILVLCLVSVRGVMKRCFEEREEQWAKVCNVLSEAYFAYLRAVWC